MHFALPRCWIWSGWLDRDQARQCRAVHCVWPKRSNFDAWSAAAALISDAILAPQPASEILRGIVKTPGLRRSHGVAAVRATSAGDWAASQERPKLPFQRLSGRPGAAAPARPRSRWSKCSSLVEVGNNLPVRRQ